MQPYKVDLGFESRASMNLGTKQNVMYETVVQLGKNRHPFEATDHFKWLISDFY